MNYPENFQIKSEEDLLVAIQNETEYLQTQEGDEIECISIENLDGILKNLFQNIKFLENA